MKINITSNMKNLDGKDIIENDKSIPLKTILVNAILNHEENAVGKKKFSDWLLAKRVHDSNKFVELSAEEATLIKEKVATSYQTVIVGQVWEILDGK